MEPENELSFSIDCQALVSAARSLTLCYKHDALQSDAAQPEQENASIGNSAKIKEFCLRSWGNGVPTSLSLQPCFFLVRRG